MTKIPVGTVMAFAGDGSDPAIQDSLLHAGWIPCWGQSVSAATYPDLAAALGTTYGGNAENVALPDLRGRFIRGAQARGGGPAFSVGQALTSLTALPQTGTFDLDTAGAHTHNVPQVPGWSNSSAYCAGHDNAKWNDGNGLTSAAGAHKHTITGGGDAESRPINVYVDFILKVLDVNAGERPRAKAA